MSVEELKTLRKSVGASHRNFADSMGVPLRTYEDLESGKSQVRPVHLNAARWAVISLTCFQSSGFLFMPNELLDRVRQSFSQP
jgi:transcriptional regulator with XRE-family HTH domain